MTIRKTASRLVIALLKVIGVMSWVTVWLGIAFIVFGLGLSALVLPLLVLGVRPNIASIAGLIGGMIAVTPVIYLFAKAVMWNRHGAQQRVWLKTNHAGYTRQDFIADLTARGLRREAVIAVYDYLERVWKPDDEWPIHPDDPLEIVYGMVVFEEIVISGFEADLPYRQPVGDEWDLIERLETAGDLAELVSRFYVSKTKAIGSL